MNDAPEQFQFQAEDILFCTMAVRVFNVEVSDIKLALQRSMESLEDVAHSAVALELMDESEVRALKKLLDCKPNGAFAPVLNDGQCKRFDTPAPGNRYRELYEHDIGGMGRILVVEDLVLGRQVALKESFASQPPVAHSQSSASTATIGIERFRREALITAQLEHPAIVPVYDLGNRGGDLYYTMKFIRGQSFLDAVAKGQTLKGRLPLLRSLIDVSQALAFAHNRGVIHRDVTPWNVMLGEFGETVVLDWGLAKRIGESNLGPIVPGTVSDPWKTQHGSLLGTPQYMSPEQAQGDTDRLDERTDVFAVGALLYLMLTAKPPHIARTPEATINLAREGKVTPIRQLEPAAPNELVTIAERSMARDPAERYQSMDELRDELVRFQDGAFLRSHQYGLVDFVQHYYRHNRLTLAAVGVSILGIIAVTTIAYLNVVRARNIEAEQRVIAETSRAEEAASRHDAQEAALRAELRLAQEHKSNGDYTRAEETLDGISITQRRPEWDLLRTLASPEALLLRTPGEAILGGRFDPTGRWIATIAGEGEFHIWDAQSGQMTGGGQVPAKSVTNLAFHADGTTLAIIATDGATYLYHVPDAKLLWSAPSTQSALSVAFSPDKVSVLVGYDDGYVRQWELADGSMLGEAKALAGPVSSLCFLTDDLVAASNPAGMLTVLHHPSLDMAYQKELSEPLVALTKGQVAASNDSGIVIFDAVTGQDQMTLKGGAGKNLLLRTEETGQFIISTVVGGPSTVWDLGKREVVRYISSNEYFVDAFVVANPLRAVTCGGRGTVSMWIGERAEPCYSRRVRDASIGMCDFSSSSLRLLTSGGTENCAVWSVDAPNDARPILYDKSPSGFSIDHVDISKSPNRKVGVRFNGVTTTIAFAPVESDDDLSILAVEGACAGAIAQFLWNSTFLFTLTPATLATWDDETYTFDTYRLDSGVAVSATSLSGSVHQFVVGNDVGELYLFDTEKRTTTFVRMTQSSPISALASSNGGEHLLVGTDDGELKLVSTETLSQVRSRNCGHGRVTGISNVPGQEGCIAAFSDGVLAKWHWDIDRIEIAPTPTGTHTDALSTVLSANLVLASSRFDPLEAFNLESLRQVFVLPRVRSLELLPDKDEAIISDQLGVVWRQALHWRSGKRLEVERPIAFDGRSPQHLDIHCYLKPEPLQLLREQIRNAEVQESRLIGVLSENSVLASVFQSACYPETRNQRLLNLQLVKSTDEEVLIAAEDTTISVRPMAPPAK